MVPPSTSSDSISQSSKGVSGNPPPPSPALLDILKLVADGKLSPIQAAGRVAAGNESAPPDLSDTERLRLAEVEGATIDIGRQARCGFGEVIYGEGKSTELMARIVQAQLEAGQDVLITRIDSTAAVQLRRSFSQAVHNSLARTLRISATPASQSGSTSDSQQPPTSSDVNGSDPDQTDPTKNSPQSPAASFVAVVTAGSTDAGVAEEAVETLRWMKIAHRRFDDIGVAGPQRLLAVVSQLRQAAAIVVVAGMEGALPAAVAGHVAVPVMAVPTSIGYGANFGGLTPLMGMLSSCAANVAVVNIDAGFKGGYLAGLIACSAATTHG